MTKSNSGSTTKTFKVGDKVEDTWYPEAGTGVITEILKTRLKVYFERATFKGGWQCPLFRGAKENAENYIRNNSHNLSAPYIFAESAYRNPEWQQIRELLIDKARTESNNVSV
jgi:hypothetical protein